MAETLLTKAFYEGLGAIAYALVKADQNISEDELRRYGTALLGEFGEWAMGTSGLRAIAQLEMLAHQQATVEDGYKRALERFRVVKEDFRDQREIVLGILANLSFADKQLNDKERELIERLKKDTRDW